MLERRTLGEVSAKPHTVFKKNKVTMSEYVFTRDGFSGGFSILYGEKAPTGLKEVKLANLDMESLLGQPVSNRSLPNTRRHFRPKQAAARTLTASRQALFSNKGCRISTVNIAAGDANDAAFCNGDGDELYFIYEGGGELWTMFGKLPIRQHDYILIPRGVAYKFKSTSPLQALCIEGDPYIEIPTAFKNPHGQLKLEAPYTHRDMRSPSDLLSKNEADEFKQILTLRNHTITEHVYHDSPCYTIGWDGSVYPIAFSINDFLPKTGKIHLPPNLHLTFQAKDFVICSFVPRLVDYGEEAIPCPYPHANVECDEILYYVSGDFTSRNGIGPQSLTLHPAGLPHGPQPGKYLASVNTQSTNELAVMIDTWQPLEMTKLCLEYEDAAYQTSWT